MKKIFLFYSLAALLLILSSCSSTRKVSRELDNSFLHSETFHQGFHGFVLYDPEEKEVLYEHNSEKYFTPASNTKLFTLYTGLKVLGDSVPGLKYTAQEDTLYLWPTGDPTFLHEEFPNSKVLDFLEEREEELVLVHPSYTETHFGPGWAWGDYNWYYSVERGAFPLYGNYVNLSFDPADSLPSVRPSSFANALEADTSYQGSASRATRDLSRNRFVFQHTGKGKKRDQKIPFIYSLELAAELLSDTLQREIGIKREVPENFAPTKTLYSIPSDTLYKKMLQVSDNFFAEQILLMSAGAIADTLKSSLAINYMQEHHLKDLPDKPQWADGSGLSRYNLFTPRTMVRLLEKITEEISLKRFLELLPAGGESGTLKNWYKAQEPYVFAKTGTLNNNHSLSGFIKTKSGKTYIFSFMNSNYVAPTSEIKKEMEQVLRTIHTNY